MEGAMDIQYLLWLQELRGATGGLFDEFFNALSKFAVNFLPFLPFIIFWGVEFYSKYVLDDKATGAFAGRVLVEHGAQKTTSQMTNQNLTATKEARMYTQPMLEIYADDVKCAHGSTVGQLNDAALFYMRQRGISLNEAKLLLQNAFINEVIDHMQLEPLRDRLHYLVEKRFRGELNKCDGCKLCK